MPIASLPMYDWPEIRVAVDRFWAALRTELALRGFHPPPELTRDRAEADVWTDPDLLISHTCGLPATTALCNDVAIIGAFDMRLPDTQPGDYHSAIVVRADDLRQELADFAGTTVAINSRDSQSGHAALVHEIAPLADGRAFFAEVVETGGHRASMQTVAAGNADIAAIDAASFRLAERHEPVTAKLRVLRRTTTRPGLPLITQAERRADTDTLADAAVAAIAQTDQADRQATGFHGFVRRTESDYAELAEALSAATRQGYPTLA